jgi:hypothetical protein
MSQKLFLLNCRKMADFFGEGSQAGDVIADHYVPGFTFPLPKCELWRDPVNKQLAHITYARDENPREIRPQANQDMYDELNSRIPFTRPAGLLRIAATFPFAAQFPLIVKLLSRHTWATLNLRGRVWPVLASLG